MLALHLPARNRSLTTALFSIACALFCENSQGYPILSSSKKLVPRFHRVADSLSHSFRSPASFSNTRKNALRVFSSLQTLFPAQNPQTSSLQPVAHSLAHAKNLTPAFPITSALFARSFAKVRNSTPVFSSAHALFVKNTREGVPPQTIQPQSASQDHASTRQPTTHHGILRNELPDTGLHARRNR